MVGGDAAAEVVIVHARQIVVDERHLLQQRELARESGTAGDGELMIGKAHRVDHFGGAGSGHGSLNRTTEHLGSGEGQDGTDTLSSGHQGVPHRLVTSLRLRVVWPVPLHNCSNIHESNFTK